MRFITSWQLVVILDQGGFLVAISIITQPRLQISTAVVKFFCLFIISGANQKGGSKLFNNKFTFGVISVEI